MFAYQRSSTFPTNRPTSSSSGDRPRTLTPRTSSDHDTIGSNETRRTSLTDEAQTCFNLLLILRQDTQHLISLRNENLESLERPSGVTEDATSSRKALLACINESIVAATRSIAKLGPFLEKCRWPATARSGLPTTQQRAGFTITFKPRRQRSKSFSEPTVHSGVLEARDSFLAPEEMFAWTLALTAQHTAVLVATGRLGTFLESGIANVSEEERQRRDARQSWWEQGRGGFENVGLIQSLLARPKRAPEDNLEGKMRPAVVTTQALTAMKREEDGTENLTPIMENDDWRSEALFSEAFTPPQNGLTVRPRNLRMGSVQEDEKFSVRRVFTEPVCSPSIEATATGDAIVSRRETFGSDRPAIPRSRFCTSRHRARLTTSPLPSAVPLQDVVSVQGLEHTTTADVASLESEYLSAQGPGLQLLTPPFTPTASPEKAKPSQADFDLQPSNLQPQQRLSTSPSPDVETPYRPYTPLDRHFTRRFTERALILSPETSIQLMGQGPGAQNIAVRVSPVDAKSRISIAPVIEYSDGSIVSPLEAAPSVIAQASVLAVSPITEPQSSVSLLDGGLAAGHEPWLEYMSRKEQVTSARWSIGSATSEI